MVKLCIFDMDGLLLDSERYMWNISMDIAAKQQGFTLTDEFHHSIMGLDKKNSIKKYYEEFGPTFDCDLFYETIEKENRKNEK